MNTLNKELKGKAVDLGLCTEWTEKWTEKTKDELCRMYILGIDFCIKHSYPNNDYMKKNFDGVMQKHGIHVSEEIHDKNVRIAVYNGKCKGVASFDNFSVGRIYLRHDSDLIVKASGYSKVFISTYDNTKLKVECSENAKVYVYRKGGIVEYSGNVRIR
jgi:hypothetical protein